MKNLIEINDFSVEELKDVVKVGCDISENPGEYMDRMKGKVMATLFFEPSTRTKFSFEAAMNRLGGKLISLSEVKNSSVSKGESLKDTVKTVGCYSDIIVMRHPHEGAAKFVSEVLDVPLINAGDGGHEHPTQTLTDLLTIYIEKGRLDNLDIALVGDIKHGRTVHSLVKALSKFENNRFYFASPKHLGLPNYLKNSLDPETLFFEPDLEKVLPKVDVVYMTRIQRERFDDINYYNEIKDDYILDEEKMTFAKEDAIIMHPLPRVNEITVGVDKDPRAKYFKQVKNGMYVRMALILKLMNELDLNVVEDKGDIKYSKCINPKCITNFETVEQVEFNQSCPYNDNYHCKYCSQTIGKE